jgi:Bcr/CflA subfamily drug resistance transporter
MKQKGVVTFFVLLLVALGQFAIDIYLPSLPAMVTDLHTDKSSVQLTLTFFLVGFAFSQLIYGPFSDRFGRRKVLLIGLAIFVVGAIGASLAQSVSFLIGMRLVQGLGIGAANVLCRAILRDIYKGKELAKKVSTLGVLWVLSPIVAPVIGGYIEEYAGWRMNFLFLICLVGLVWLWCIFFLPETKDPTQIQSIHPREIVKNYALLLSSRPFMGYVLVDFFMYGIFSAFYVAGPFLLQKVLNVSPIMFGWMMLIISFGYMVGTYINIRALHYWEPKKIIKCGLVLIFVISSIMLALALCDIFNITAIVLPLSILFCAIALLFTNCIGICLSIFHHLAGSASALWGFLAYLGGTLATFVMSALPEKSQTPLNVVIFTLCILAIFSASWGNFHLSKIKND